MVNLVSARIAASVGFEKGDRVKWGSQLARVHGVSEGYVLIFVDGEKMKKPYKADGRDLEKVTL